MSADKSDAAGIKVDGPSADAKLRAGGIVLRRGPSKGVLEVLLVSRRQKPNSFTVPAGKYETEKDQDSFEACALRETKEEAGIDCEILFDLGWYRATAAKDNRETRTHFFGMRYVRDCSDWQEELERQRCWYCLDEAIRRVEWNPMLRVVLEHVQEQHLLQASQELEGADAEDPCPEEVEAEERACKADSCKKVKLTPVATAVEAH